MPGVRRDWVAEMEELTAAGPDWPADAAAAAERDAGELVALARNLVDEGQVPPSCASPDRCALARVEPRLCDLVRGLARLTPPAAADVPAQRGAAVAAFLEALAEAGSVIYVCRRVLHPTGGCLFSGRATGGPFAAESSPPPAVPTTGDGAARVDLCAEVLLAAHRLGGSSAGGNGAHAG